MGETPDKAVELGSAMVAKEGMGDKKTRAVTGAGSKA
jgi:hypothetical protein